ncbi:class I SAM-dependent methyltransferase [Pullulanibacillus sp. KACC 23026]|uniref:class I SAM-dependent methyltransferase n=1 Tax=Pullulanibacillus sp. KACC 23026 TaxID=3028315 RepID=UPI0023AFDD7E|nr:class I SAM-dependent methyltransferase [Pullulanibacillus sp. KACC 23026]WEG13883.1 class I SAM-dependent methyltransferase [Pullulanibacillus sp. KACC 23026]
MVLETEVTRLFSALDQSVQYLAEAESQSYLESLIQVGPYITDQEIPETFEKTLLASLDPFWSGTFTKESIRRAFQLSVLKGLKSTDQAHHHVTPDTVSLFMGYLAQLLNFKQESVITVLDLAVGSANLITAVLNQLKTPAHGIGVDVDDLMIRLAMTNANLQQTTLELFRQDAFRPLLIDPADLVVSDLPVGYYPDKQQAQSFKVAQESEQPFSHHLMIEQHLTYLKPGGYAIMMVPNTLFQEDERHRLNQLIQEEAVILGFLQLPSSLFKTDSQGRSLLILQKQGEGVQKPKQALLAQLPSFSNKEAFSSMLLEIQNWFKDYQSSKSN